MGFGCKIFSMIKFRIRTQFLTLLILTGLIPLMIVGGLFYFQASNSMIKSSFSSISSIQEIRKRQLEETSSRQVAGFLSILNSVDFSSVLKDNSSAGDFLGATLINNGFYNLYILSYDKGEVLYNFLGEKGYTGDSGLTKVWGKALSSSGIAVQDFSPFIPSKGMSSGFLGRTYNINGQNYVIAIQFTSDFIGKTLKSTEGMGRTGESYIVGYNPDNDKYEFRSNLVTIGNGEYKIGTSLKFPMEYWLLAVENGVKGGIGTFRDSTNNRVLVKYDKLISLVWNGI
jgi:hypothetical protein